MSGEINETSRQLGELAGTVKGLTDQQSALFRKLDAQNTKIEALTVSFTGYSQAQLEAASGLSRRIQSVEVHMDEDVDPDIKTLNDFKTQHEEQSKIKARQTLTLIGVGGAAGGLLSQAIDYFRGVT